MSTDSELFPIFVLFDSQSGFLPTHYKRFYYIKPRPQGRNYRIVEQLQRHLEQQIHVIIKTDGDTVVVIHLTVCLGLTKRAVRCLVGRVEIKLFVDLVPDIPVAIRR